MPLRRQFTNMRPSYESFLGKDPLWNIALLFRLCCVVMSLLLSCSRRELFMKIIKFNYLLCLLKKKLLGCFLDYFCWDLIFVTWFQTDALVRLLPLIGSSSIRYLKKNFIFVHVLATSMPRSLKTRSLKTRHHWESRIDHFN